MNCRSPGCARRVAGYSNLCAAHAKRKRRHGHAEQTGITLDRLKPHLELVRHFLARRSDQQGWSKLEAAWATVIKDAAGIVAEAHSGRPFLLHEAEAAAQIVRVAETARPRAVIETVAALAIMRDREPEAFKSDEAAFVQIARRFRSLSSSSKRRHYSLKEGRVKTHEREQRRDVAIALGQMLSATLGVLGTKIAEGAEREHHQRALTWQDAYAALKPAA